MQVFSSLYYSWSCEDFNNLHPFGGKFNQEIIPRTARSLTLSILSFLTLSDTRQNTIKYIYSQVSNSTVFVYLDISESQPTRRIKGITSH